MIKNKKAGLPIIAIILMVLVVGAGAYYVYGSFKGTISGTPVPPPDTSKSQVTLSPSCPSGQLMDNSGSCIIPPCPTGQARDNSGSCVVINPNVNPGVNPLPLTTPCEVTGYFKDAYAFHKKKVGDTSDLNRGAPISYRFVVTNSCTANIYLEAGIVDTSKLTILATQPSACDGNKHYAGRFVSGNKDTQFASNVPKGQIDVAFFPQDYGKEGTFKLIAGVYSGCYKDGGKTINEVPAQLIGIRNLYTDTEISNSVTKII